MFGIRQFGSTGHQHDPLVIGDDDEEPSDVSRRIRRIEEEVRTGQQLAEQAVARNARHVTNHEPASESPTPSDDFGQEEQIEDLLEDDIAGIIDLTGDDIATPILTRRSRIILSEDETELPHHTLPSGLLLKPGVTIELNHALSGYKIQFVRIKSILRPAWSSEVLVRGWGFSRAGQLEGMIPRKRNEVVLIAELRSSGRKGWQEEALLDVQPSDIKSEREMRVTNAPFPEHRFDASELMRHGKEWVGDHSPLVCRYRYEIHYHGDCEKPFELALVRIGEDEADQRYRILDSQNLNRWRGGKVPGGSYNPNGDSHPVVDLEETQASNSRTPRLLPDQRYTAGDVFAGAGGASRGIERAGVKLMFAVDHWEHAADSLRANFAASGSRIYHMDVTEFITSKATTCTVDMLHLSPPCQFWSPAHTVAGKNDEHNIAVLFSCGDLVEKFRPRLFTVEQTFGILSPKFTEFFNTFLHGFTNLGYSVRWKVAPLANYGVPQLRKRLMMIGSAPGEKLPPIPPPTHSKDGAGGLKPWATPKSIVGRLSPRYDGHKLHQPQQSKRFDPPKQPWDPTKLAKTITTSGGQNYHWNGKRDFTLLEYAVLQGFPVWHKFEGRSIKKQIGNAFAPSVVKVLYDHLVRWLHVQDGIEPSPPRPARNIEYITLDDDDDDDNDGDDDMNNAEEDERGDEDDLLISPISRTLSPGTSPGSNNPRTRRLSEAVRRLNRAAKEEDRGSMDLDGLEDLSDTETLRDGDSGSGTVADDYMDVDVVGLTMDVGKGTADDPFVLSD
jgi:DNA (cytosine-5)-methyltransferase 1